MNSIQKSSPVRLAPIGEPSNKPVEAPKAKFKPVLAQRSASRALVAQSTQESPHTQSNTLRPRTNPVTDKAVGRIAHKLDVAKEGGRKDVRDARGARSAKIAQNQAQKALAASVWHPETPGAKLPFVVLADVFDDYNKTEIGTESSRRAAADQTIAKLPPAMQSLANALFDIQTIAATLGDEKQKGGVSPLLLKTTPGTDMLSGQLALQATVGQIPVRFSLMTSEAKKLATGAKPGGCMFALKELPGYAKSRASVFAAALDELAAFSRARTRPAGIDKASWPRIQADAQKLHPVLSKLAAAWNHPEGIVQQMAAFTGQLIDKPLVAAQLIASKQS